MIALGRWLVLITALASLGCAASLPPVDLQGHRGARGLEPENSLPAFARALAIGVTTLELDVGITRDGVVVVSHDERLNPDIARLDGRFLSAPGPAIAQLGYGELAHYDVGRLRPGSAYAARFPQQRGYDGVRIPRLSEVVAMAERASRGTIRYNVETKLTPPAPDAPPLTVAPEAFAERVVAELRAMGVAQRATIQSFDWRTLRVVQRIAPEIETVCLSSQQDGFDTILEGEPGPSPWTAGLDVDDYGVVTALVHAAGCDVWSPDFHDVHTLNVARAHAVGLRIAVWTVNESRDIDAMLSLGVDAIISDYPDRVRADMQRRGMVVPPVFYVR